MDLFFETVKFIFPAYFGLETSEKREKKYDFRAKRENHVFSRFSRVSNPKYKGKMNFTVETN